MKLPHFLAHSGLFLSMLGVSHMSAAQVVMLDATVVTGESEAVAIDQRGWLPAVQGAAIFAGKKTAVIDLDGQARNVGNSYRTALSQTPGLLLAEESSPLVSIGYRGLDPHRAQFMQVLKDGIPIHADQFGYPESYYTPPLDTVDRIEFMHGGAALQHGPQPGGALNYITHRPRTDKEFSMRTQHVGGSHDLYSTFSSADGTVGKLGYYLYYNHRESDGFRSVNSDYSLDNGAIKLLHTLENGGVIIFNADRYEEKHGEPGGLSVADFNAGSVKATKKYDRMKIARDAVSLTYELAPTPDSFWVTNAWWTAYDRFSWRQRGGGFGVDPSGLNAGTNDIEDQHFETLAIDSRYRSDWGGDGDKRHSLSTGVQFYHMDSPRVDSRGASADAESGTVRRISDREVFYAPVFVENRFVFGDFSITPGLRLENVSQEVEEKLNLDKTPESRDEDSNILLGGLGAEYATDDRSALYANISQAYRPMIFTQAVPLGGGEVVNDDLSESESIEYEIGYRSRPEEWLSFDASLFLLSFKDKVGSIKDGGLTYIENVGDAIHKGLDVGISADLLRLVTGSEREDAIEWYLNATLLDAEFVDGRYDGKAPQYAADHIVRTGFNYRRDDKLKLSFGGTFLSDHYANDSNDDEYAVPAYMVWDLTAEWKVHENIRLLAGINNLFDESYFARVRADGIDPADGRNFYAGASFEF
ncbi:MAG: TonB-dependent receptor [Verrucomicrobia bacterium]|nr:TonB-dependent receptor [Verrucomicrobiota bacterium]